MCPFHRMSSSSLLVLVLVIVLAGCGPQAEPPAPADEGPGALLAIRNARIPMDGVLSGGQPTPEQLEAAARAGFRTVINLRTEQEDIDWERAVVEDLGMRYVHIPVAGSEGLTRENVERVDAALREGIAEGSVLFHCGSGNRIGAVLALREAWIHGAEPASALEHGAATGMTRLEGEVRALLGLEDG